MASRKSLLIILHYLGYIMQGLGIVLLSPIIVELIYGDYFNCIYFIIPCMISFALGTIFVRSYKNNEMLKLKYAMVVSSLAWLWASLISAVIMVFYVNAPFIDAFFENMSAWTGSGLTLFADVEILPYSILFLRSLEQWIGGLGVVVIFVTVLIRSGTSAARLYKSEAREEKLSPNIRNTLRKSLQIYLLFTGLGLALYILAGLPVFDAINLTFTTISTGGMSIKNANVGFYHDNIVYAITMFLMILGATSFTVHYKIIKTRGKSFFKDIQVQVMLSLIILATLGIIFLTRNEPIETLFHVISAITTTGANISSPAYMTTWPSLSLMVLMVLMMIGGSSGSTVGAMKIIRVITAIKGINLTLTKLISPQGRVLSVKIAGKKLKETEIREATAYLFLYLVFLLFGWGVFLYFGYDPFQSLFDIISTQGNVGLSLGVIGPGLPDAIKIVLTFLMWIGRLEIIPVLILIRAFALALKDSIR
ncbi:MAG: TrkH family potassium uptake protein [Methanobrevibacter sp.]|nr:TrkH family potassium uptake protein [Methanobrevibacter sp.]